MSHFKWQRIVWTSILAAMSSNLFAVDGVVLIDQNRALAGNVTPGDTPGFPVTISQPGSYRLSGNLTVPDVMTTAIQITADHVSLDLNGFSIIGPNVCTPNPTTCTFSNGIGVHAGDFNAGSVPPRGVRVLNGTVRGMGFHGIRLPGAGTAAERVNAHSNGGPGIFANTVIDSMAFVNRTNGIIASTVQGSTAAQNGSAGIFVRQGGVAIANSSRNNDGYGINATCPSSIIGNTFVANQAGNIHTAPPGGSNAACTLANNAQ